MKKWILFLFIIFFIFIILFIKPTNNSQNNINAAVSKGYVFLNNNYNKDSGYDDIYLKYVYLGENLYCPADGCSITYRILDAYFGILFIKQLGGYNEISNQVSYADNVLSSLIPLWQKQAISNTKKSTINDKDGIALDTYCILGYIYSDNQMAQKSINYLDGDKWLDINYYKEDVWRNVADESWCIRLLIETKQLEKDKIKALISKKIEETDQMVSSDLDLVTKVVTVMHMVYTLYDFSTMENDSIFNNKLSQYQEYVFSSFKDKTIKNDDLTLSNVLDVLAYSKYDKTKLQDMLNILVSRQQRDGGWYHGGSMSKSNLGVFTTLRVITSIKRFEAI